MLRAHSRHPAPPTAHAAATRGVLSCGAAVGVAVGVAGWAVAALGVGAPAWTQAVLDRVHDHHVDEVSC